MENDILKYERPALTADCVLFTIAPKTDADGWKEVDLQVRLVKRDRKPERTKWALPGAFVPIDKRVEDVMRAAVENKAGIKDSFYSEQLMAFDTPGRDERWRVVSIAYLGVLNGMSGSSQYAEDAYWFNINPDTKTLYQPLLDIEISFDDLAFDHSEILSVGIEKLQAKVTYSDIALNFLDEYFTIANIKAVMEAVTRKPFNNVKRAFQGLIEEVTASQDDGSNDEPRAAHRPSVKYQRATNETNEQIAYRNVKQSKERTK